MKQSALSTGVDNLVGNYFILRGLNMAEMNDFRPLAAAPAHFREPAG
jgi:hypothetical protein